MATNLLGDIESFKVGFPFERAQIRQFTVVLALPILIWGNVVPPRGTKEQAGYSLMGALLFSGVVYLKLNSAIGGVLLLLVFCLTNYLIFR